ncbi:MAG: hypothetical protein ACREPL_10375, partial [Rhodanobacteraceae bacterium]
MPTPAHGPRLVTVNEAVARKCSTRGSNPLGHYRHEKTRRSGLFHTLVKEAYATCTWSACMPFGPLTAMKVT